MRQYWKITRENLKNLPDGFLTNEQYIYFYTFDNYKDGYIFISKNGDNTAGWMKYNNYSTVWYFENKFKYMGEYKTISQTRKEKLDKIKCMYF